MNFNAGQGLNTGLGIGRGTTTPNTGNTIQTTLSFNKPQTTMGGGILNTGTSGFNLCGTGTTNTTTTTNTLGGFPNTTTTNPLSGQTGFQTGGQGQQTTSGTSFGGQSNFQSGTGFNTGLNTGGFGIKPTTTTNPIGTGMGLGSQTTSNIGMGSTGMNTGMGFNQPQSNPQIMMQSGRKELDKQEIIHVIQNFLSSADPKDPNNLYKYMLYNSFPQSPEGLSPQLLGYNQYMTLEDGSLAYIDYNLWVRALDKNPNSNNFYPFQISSVQHLKSRIMLSNFFTMNAMSLITDNQSKIAKTYDVFNKEIDNYINLVKNNHEEIKNQQFRLMSKIEIMAQKSGKAEFNYNNYNILSNKLSSLKTKAIENLEKVSQLNQVADVNVDHEGELLKDFTKERLEKSMNALVDMKKVMEANFSFLEKTLKTVNVIKQDMENIKKYRKPYK